MQRARIEISFLVFRSRAKQMSQRPSPAWLHQAGVGSVPTWFTLKPTGFLSIDFLNGPPPFWANPRTLLMADENHNITGKQFSDPMCIWFNQNLEETEGNFIHSRLSQKQQPLHTFGCRRLCGLHAMLVQARLCNPKWPERPKKTTMEWAQLHKSFFWNMWNTVTKHGVSVFSFPVNFAIFL